MSIRKIGAAAMCAAVVCLLAGCGSTQPAQYVTRPVENTTVVLAEGRTLRSAITAAATRRRWLPSAQADGTIRCTLTQREHLVVVDVVPTGPNSFSIRPVKSNIPARKFDQWVNNLCREIVFQASR